MGRVVVLLWWYCDGFNGREKGLNFAVVEGVKGYRSGRVVVVVGVNGFSG